MKINITVGGYLAVECNDEEPHTPTYGTSRAKMPTVCLENFSNRAQTIWVGD